MDFTTIALEMREDGIAILTLSRPAVVNAINIQMIEEFNAAMDQLRRAFDTRVLLITGADRLYGRPAFSAGLDLKEVNTVGDKKLPEGAPDWLDFPDYSKRFFQFQKELYRVHCNS
jgi:enoyl-CoA hydratase